MTPFFFVFLKRLAMGIRLPGFWPADTIAVVRRHSAAQPIPHLGEQPMAIELISAKFSALSRNPKIEQVGWIVAKEVAVGAVVTVVKNGNPKRHSPSTWKGGWVGLIAHQSGTDGFNNPGWDVHLKYVPAGSAAEEAAVDVGETENLTVSVVPLADNPVSVETPVETVP